MKRIKDISEINEKFITVIGNFDGMHKGHEYLISKAKELGAAHNAKICVLTFSPHPKVLFSNKRHFLITSNQNKESRSKSLGVDYYFEIPFTKECAKLSAIKFLAQYIESEFLAGMFIGHDFALGRDRQGDSQFLANYCSQKQIVFDKSWSFYINKDLVSSSLIRKVISESNFMRTQKLLGHPYSLEGRITSGKGLGRTIGIPTINITIDRELLYPEQGVYRVDIVVNKQRYMAVTNIGTNPTTDSDLNVKIETHIIEEFNYAADVNEIVEIFFIQRIRDEKKFNNLDELKNQIQRDVTYAKTL